MKKFVVATMAMLLLTGISAYANGGKKKAKKAKAASQKECCIPFPNCDKSKCNSVKYTEAGSAVKADGAKQDCCAGQSSCKKS